MQIPEVGIMRLNNQRDGKLDESSINQSQDQIRQSLEGGKSARGDGAVSPDNAADVSVSFENFNFEELPAKMILVDPKSTEDTHLIVYHAGKLSLFKICFRGPIPFEKGCYRRREKAFQGAR